MARPATTFAWYRGRIEHLMTCTAPTNFAARDVCQDARATASKFRAFFGRFGRQDGSGKGLSSSVDRPEPLVFRKLRCGVGPVPGATEDERGYRSWCLLQRLFISPLNDLGTFAEATTDMLHLPSVAKLTRETLRPEPVQPTQTRVRDGALPAL